MKTIYHLGYRQMVNRLREARLEAKLSLAALGTKVGRGKNWLHRIETAQSRLDVLEFVRLCRTLNLNSSVMLKELEESSDDDSFLAISPA